MVEIPDDELQQMALFGGLLVDSLRVIGAVAPLVSRPKGDAFFRQGDDGDSLYVMLSGTAVSSLASPDWSYVLRQIEVGDSFGEAAYVDLQPRQNTVIAQTDCRAVELGPEAMQALWRHNAEQFTLLQMNIARELSRRLRDSDQQRLVHWADLCGQ